ncbi:hypothetical protein Salat_0843400 [Sesamum alatum]|uniref:Uncharacterized protein n=1 Tax=Sesamum alatum TaxID=300844 RepID=A0AAE2CQJ1_9LAMI|nr:hypothetical protein Salat_0843400 [Sesamum alatum]
MLNHEYDRSLKFSLKGLGDKSPRKSKEYGKKSSNKKYGKKKGNETSIIVGNDAYQSIASLSPVAGDFIDDVSAANEAAVSKNRNVEVTTTNATKASRTIKIKSSKSHGLNNREESGTNSGGSKATQGPELVIHFGDEVEMQPVLQDLKVQASKGVKNCLHQMGPKLRGKESHVIKLKNAHPELFNVSSKLTGGEFGDGYESFSPKTTYSILGKWGTEDSASARSGSEVPASTKDRQPFLKFKIPNNSNNGNQNVPSNFSTGTQNALPLPGKEEITYTRGKGGTVEEVLEGTLVVSIALDDGKTKTFRSREARNLFRLRSRNIDLDPRNRC